MEVGESIISGSKEGEFRIGVIELTVDLVSHLGALQQPYENSELPSLFQYLCDVRRRRRPRGFRRRLPKTGAEEEEEEEDYEREEAIHDPFLLKKQCQNFSKAKNEDSFMVLWW